MLKDLRNLKKYHDSIWHAKRDLEEVTGPYRAMLMEVQTMASQIQRKMDADIEVLEARSTLEDLEKEYAILEAKAKQAVVDYWQEFGFSTGKKSDIMEGCKVSIREITNRQVVNPNEMVVAAREDGVYEKVIKELRPILNKAAFNSWVDLKSPPGVEVTEDISATVTVLEKE